MERKFYLIPTGPYSRIYTSWRYGTMLTSGYNTKHEGFNLYSDALDHFKEYILEEPKCYYQGEGPPYRVYPEPMDSDQDEQEVTWEKCNVSHYGNIYFFECEGQGKRRQSR
eukprot:3170899-Ditylum_brightwellii.AAC.1